MAKLCIQHLAIYNNENVPDSKENFLMQVQNFVKYFIKTHLSAWR